ASVLRVNSVQAARAAGDTSSSRSSKRWSPRRVASSGRWRKCSSRDPLKKAVSLASSALATCVTGESMRHPGRKRVCNMAPPGEKFRVHLRLPARLSSPYNRVQRGGSISMRDSGDHPTRRSVLAGGVAGLGLTALAQADVDAKDAPISPKDGLKITKLETFPVKPR